MSEKPESRTIEDAACLACGCLCDDLALTVEVGRIVEAANACPIGRAWLLADHGPGGRPEATIEGRPVSRAEALARAAEVLAASRSPLVTGLTGTTIEAQAAAVALADRLGATIDPAHSPDAAPALAAFQRVGRVSATLGEVRNRAEVVVFWGVDPIATHPRHWERYSVAPRGRFVPEGRAGRFVAVVDAERTATAERADRFLRLEPDRQLAALSALRAIVRGARLDPGRVEAASGVAFDELVGLAERLKSARYGAFFHGSGLGRAPGGAACAEAALTLVRDLNAVGSRRFVILPLGGPGNATGAEAVLAWQASSPIACDLARGFPRHLPDEATAEARLARGEADAALIVVDDPRDRLSPAARDRLASIPTVVVAPDATDPARAATVGLASATVGIHAGGSVMRCDGVTLPLRPALATDLPTDRDWLASLGERLAPHVGGVRRGVPGGAPDVRSGEREARGAEVMGP